MVKVSGGGGPRRARSNRYPPHGACSKGEFANGLFDEGIVTVALADPQPLLILAYGLTPRLVDWSRRWKHESPQVGDPYRPRSRGRHHRSAAKSLWQAQDYVQPGGDSSGLAFGKFGAQGLNQVVAPGSVFSPENSKVTVIAAVFNKASERELLEHGWTRNPSLVGPQGFSPSSRSQHPAESDCGREGFTQGDEVSNPLGVNPLQGSDRAPVIPKLRVVFFLMIRRPPRSTRSSESKLARGVPTPKRSQGTASSSSTANSREASAVLPSSARPIRSTSSSSTRPTRSSLRFTSASTRKGTTTPCQPRLVPRIG